MGTKLWVVFASCLGVAGRLIAPSTAGKHTFTATATDAAGNEDDSPAIWNFKVVR